MRLGGAVTLVLIALAVSSCGEDGGLTVCGDKIENDPAVGRDCAPGETCASLRVLCEPADLPQVVSWTDASADGTVLVGTVVDVYTEESVAFRWTETSGMVGLGKHRGASGVSADGTLVVGGGASAKGVEAFRWAKSRGMDWLGDLPGGPFRSYAHGISADGTVVVGESWSDNGWEAFRWTKANGMVGLGDLPGGEFFSCAKGASADGAVIVGDSTSGGGGDAPRNTGNEAFRWTETSGMVGLGDLPGGLVISRVGGISADGTIVVGGSESDNGMEAFRWTEADGMVGLGHLPGDASSFAGDVSGDGSVVVGSSWGNEGVEAFRWTQAGGLESIEALLRAEGVELSGQKLGAAIAVSDDGRTIAGGGWIATLPLP